MIPDDAEPEHLTSHHDIAQALPFRLEEGSGLNLRVPVYEAYNDDATPGPKPARSSAPEFEVQVNVQNLEDGGVLWGLWDPHDDEEEYLGHSVQTGSRYDARRTATGIEEWLNELLFENPDAVEEFKV